MMPLTGDVIEFCRGPVVVLHCLHASLCRHALPRWPHGTASEEERRPYPSVVIAFITLVYTTHLPSSSRLVRKVLPRALPFGILHRGKAVVDFGVEVVSPARPLETRDRVRVPWSMLSGQFSQDAAGDVYDSQWKRRKGSGFCGRCSLDNYSKTQLLTSMTPGVVDVTRCVLVESGSRRRHPLPRLYQDAAVDVDDSRSRRRQPLRLGRIWSRRRHRCVLIELSGEHRSRNSDPFLRFRWPGGTGASIANMNDGFACKMSAGSAPGSTFVTSLEDEESCVVNVNVMNTIYFDKRNRPFCGEELWRRPFW